MSFSKASPVRSPWRNELSATLKLAWPLVLTQIATIALNTVDVIMIGWLGPDELAAATLATSLVFPMTFFGIGLLAATAAMFSQEIGAIRLRGVRRTLRQGFWVAISLCLPCMALLWNAEDLMRAMGQDPWLAAKGAEYTRVALWGLIPLMCFTVLRNFVTAHSRPRSAMVILILSIGVNALADYALIFGNFGAPALGLVGAAAATVIVQCFMLFGQTLFVVTDRQFRRYNLFGRFWRPDWLRYIEIMKIGVPIGLTVLAEAGLFAASSFMVGLFGPDQLAAHAVALQCSAFVFMIPLGISQAATIRVGLAAGRQRMADALLAGRTSTTLGVGVAAFTAVIFWLAAETLVGFFLRVGDPENTAAIGFAVTFLKVAAVFQLVDAGQAVGAGSLRGIKDTTVPAALAFFGYWIFGFSAGAYLAFVYGLEGAGVWMGLAVGLTVACIALILRFEILMRKALRPLTPAS
ncbi:MATE family efflux transporter [Nisaea acidiphila]|uniref:Multidrug-efflux transporter n=1 Tax=Nisaea acidiphila TaxID=1862145 RepID=A0A9J7AX37_9PROT|nr:MATE family efflux transporter [Nisaea acidiphila]UUX50812.1 MATE family efflux transporter [Nisaea acidiphila]